MASGVGNPIGTTIQGTLRKELLYVSLCEVETKIAVISPAQVKAFLSFFDSQRILVPLLFPQVLPSI